MLICSLITISHLFDFSNESLRLNFGGFPFEKIVQILAEGPKATMGLPHLINGHLPRYYIINIPNFPLEGVVLTVNDTMRRYIAV